LLSLPYVDGRAVLLKVGDPLEVILPEGGGRNLKGTVVRRRTKPIPSVVVHLTAVPGGLTGGKGCTTYAVASGKGGVGKTVLAVNLALALSAQGKKVILVDADLGTADVAVFLRLDSKYNLADVVCGERDIAETLTQGPQGIEVVPGGSGTVELASLSEWQFGKLLTSLAYLERLAEVMIIDTGAGVSQNVTNFLLTADNIIVVTTPEPPALLDAYALVKAVYVAGRRDGMGLVVNRSTEAEARRVHDKLAKTARRFLSVDIQYLGFIPRDNAVSTSTLRQVPLLSAFSGCPASRQIRKLARLLAQEDPLGAPKLEL